ncbi:Phosphoenolpyruvate-protein kinase (PTS system EI component in bacteria) [Halapricum desulfuricans]|uniref:Phosphoenolpyruvate-protein phosphotransferase n=1 Tax=Halapricum desulfuricans TaxID=2841257 RepID=A0A897NJJ4_9EURY|nr:phosphoenolpyruvate--protein phosphotransferase [Halapricum desulfuricans]QSG12614.1 Phosphoenolpyruvate-protein kinase (PTS system EI component in bacteria) [Halapricum desulfuricans]
MSERRLEGVGVTPLSGVGTVIWYDQEVDLPEPPAPDEVDPDAEHDRFETALDAAREELQAERDRTAEEVGEDEAAIFDAHLQFLDDPQITGAVEDAIDEGVPAEHAVREGFEGAIEQMEAAGGRMAERADDLRDIRDRLLRIVTDSERLDLSELPEGTVLLAEMLTPSDTAQLDPERVAGFATAKGGRTSHAAIFARSIGIPAVVGVGEQLLEIEADAEIVVDGEAGEVVVDPDEATRERAAESRDVEIRTERVETADGEPVEVAANIGTAAELEGAVAQGADAVGLFRTEFLFLDRATPPDEDEQLETYVEALDAFPEGRVVVRTLDIGGDKPIPYVDAEEEENPFLGTRGIRRSLGPDAELFRTQLRALLRAGAEGDGELAVMFPMVATVEEVDRSLAVIEDVRAELDEDGLGYEMPELGVMVETPAAVFMGEQLAERLDFFSIGTNDLTQYVMAASRQNEAVAHLHNPRDPAVLRAIDRAVDAAHAGDAWIGMCGEMAGDPELTELLVGLGLDELSMSAVTIPNVKGNVVEIDTAEAREFAEQALASETRAQVNELLEE